MEPRGFELKNFQILNQKPSRPRMALVIASLFFGVTSRVNAFCLHYENEVLNRYSESDAVFIAKVLSTTSQSYDEKNDKPGDLTYKVSVARVLKGHVGRSIKLITENASGRTWLEDGRTYILFTSKTFPFDRKRVSAEPVYLMGCGDQSEFQMPGADAKLAEVLEAQDALKAHAPGEVRVRVLEKATSKPLKGINFRISGSGLEKTLSSDEKGWASTSVPAGKYAIEAIEPDRSICMEVWNMKKVKFEVKDSGGWMALFYENRECPKK